MIARNYAFNQIHLYKEKIMMGYYFNYYERNDVDSDGVLVPTKH